MRYSTPTVNAQTRLISSLLAGGMLQLFGGDRPADPDDPPGDAALLGELAFGDPALAEPTAGQSDGALEGAYILQDGRLTWFRGVNAQGVVVLDGRIGTDDDAELQVDQLDVEQDARLKPTRFSYISPRHT